MALGSLGKPSLLDTLGSKGTMVTGPPQPFSRITQEVTVWAARHLCLLGPFKRQGQAGGNFRRQDCQRQGGTWSDVSTAHPLLQSFVVWQERGLVQGTTCWDGVAAVCSGVGDGRSGWRPHSPWQSWQQGWPCWEAAKNVLGLVGSVWHPLNWPWPCSQERAQGRGF